MTEPNRRTSRPPRSAEVLLGALLPWQYRDETLGDLHEGFARRVREGGEGRARRWYVRQALRSIPAALRLRYQTRHDSTSREGSMDTIGQDTRYALRSLWKSPGFAVVSIVTLALAIGVNTSIFSLVNAIVFADLPFQETETATLIRSVNTELEIDQGSVSAGDYLDLVERSRSFESMAALTEGRWVLTGGDQPVRVEGLRMTVGTDQTWRLPPVLGRSFLEGEDVEGRNQVAMLTYGFWQDFYSGRPDVLGESIMLDGREYTIVGVANPKLEFASFRVAKVIVPLVIDRADPDRTRRMLFVSGRLAPGVSQEMATAEVRQIGLDLEERYPEQNRGWGLWAAPVMESLMDDDGNTILLLLQLTVGMVILIACANVANMLLSRATSRAREFGVRSALGAGRGRLVRQLLTESVIISLCAAGLGFGIAWLLNRALIWISAGTEEVFLMAELNGRVLGFTLLVALLAPIVFGLFPALRASASGASSALRDGRSGDGGRSGKRARSALVTAQVSLALTLMIVASLLVRTVVAMQARPLGFDPSDVLTVQIELPEGDYSEDGDAERFFAQARDRVGAVPGFSDVQLTNVLPGADFGALRSLEVEGLDWPEERAAPTAFFTTASAGFFEALGLDLQSGRTFQQTDNGESFLVAVVSRAIASEYWPEQDPLGRRFRRAGEEAWIQVVGVVADVRSTGDTDQASPNVYVPHAQDERRSMYLVARTAREPSAVAGPIREAIWGIDSQLPLGAIRTLERAHYENSASTYALITLFVTFAVFALLMAAVGIYGVMAYSVSQRRAEIGLRMALGAEASAVRWMIVSQGARLMVAGVVIGLLAALGMSRLLANLVFGVSPTDPLTFIGVPLVLMSVALVANMIPARRATRTDPATTLRAD